MKATIRSKARKELDNRLVSADPIRPEIRYKPPSKGWIRAIRDALGMSSDQLARRVSLRSQSIDDWEKAEANGSIQLKTLRRAAHALDCTFVYALIPKSTLEGTVKSRARNIAVRELKRVSQTMKLEDQATEVDDQSARIEEYIREHVKDRDIWNEP